MSYVAEYERINWENYSSTKTPLSAQNLNKIDYAVKKHDEACATFDLTKLEKSEALSMLADVTYNSSTGVFTFTRKNGTQIVADINIEKIPVSFSMDENGIITMTTSDGSTYTADVGSLIKKYDFIDSETIDLIETYDSSSKKTKVKAEIIDGSVTEEKLQPNFLADCRIAKDNAETASNVATTSASMAEGYSVGEQNGEPVEEGSPYYQNNAKYYAEQAGTKTARAIEYDRTASGISADNVQGAIDEIVTKVNSKADVSALVAKADKTQLSNRNLLDNPWFTVNQRGQSRYSGSEYAVDRWKTANSVMVVNNGYITFSSANTWGNIYQLLNYSSEYANKTFTMSIEISADSQVSDLLFAMQYMENGVTEKTIKQSTISVTSDRQIVTMEFTMPNLTANDLLKFRIGNIHGLNEEIKIYRAKLELGTISTLANDLAPNYAEELLKCQRYFVRFRANTGSHGFVLAHPISTTLLRIPLTLPCWMNSNTPTVTLAGSLRTTPSASDAQIVCSGLSRIDMMANVIILQTTISSGSLQIGGNYMMVFGDSNTYIDISAEL